jgi:RNA polymerase sigma factor, sigma-70 family
MKQNPHLPGTPEEFVKSNMGLAQKVAWGFIKSARNDEYIKFDKDDFLSIAYLGLVKVYHKFDPTKFSNPDGNPVKFSTYAVPVIRGIIMIHTRDYAYTIRNKDRNGLHIFTDSLDRPVDEHGEITVLDTLKASSFDNYDQLYIDDFLSQLQPKFKKLYELRIVQELPQQVIAEKFGVSQVHISRLEKELFRLAEEYGRGQLEKAG